MFSGLHYPLTRSNGICGTRGQKGASVEEKGKGPWQRNIIIMIFFLGEEKVKTREDKKNRQTRFLFFIFSKMPFLGHVFKKSTHSIFGAWSFLLTQIRFTPSKGPKDHGSWTKGRKKTPSSMVRLHDDPRCKLALYICFGGCGVMSRASTSRH